MDANILRQIQRIGDNNAQHIARIRSLYSETVSLISKDEWDDYDTSIIISKSNIINKKMRDSAISLNKIYRTLIYDNYQSSALHFSKRAEHVSNTMPALVDKDATITFSAQFANLGVFYSWTLDKGIFAELSIQRTDGSIYHSERYPLDTSIEQNIPGNQSENGDYMSEKIFNFSYVADMPPGAYVFSMRILDTALDDYNSTFSKPVTVR